MKRWGIAVKIVVTISALALVGIVVSTLVTVSAGSRSVMQVQKQNASERLAGNVRLARAVFDERYPGPWHLVPAGPNDPAIEIFNGNGRLDRYRERATLPANLYKGSVKILGNADVEQALVQLDSLTGMELTVAQRIPPAQSSDSTVGAARDGRALRVATTVNRAGADGTLERQLLTIMPMRNVKTGGLAGAGAAFATGTTFDGLATVAGQDRWTRYEPILGPDGNVIGIFYGGLSMAPFAAHARDASWSLARNAMGYGLLSLVVFAIVLYRVTQVLLRPLRTVRAAALQIAAGHLGARANLESTDEIGHVGRAFDDMAAQLQGLNERIVVATEQLTASSKQVDSAAAAAAVATQQVASSIGEVSHGAAESAGRVEEATKQAHAALAHVRAIQDEVERALLEAGATDVLASDGHRLIARSLTLTDGIRVSVGRARGVMNELQQQAEQIQSIVAMIKRIASQTNLLALNAAIEAARAGDAGKGFAVVATEIRSLADEVRKSSDSIGQLVGETKRRTTNAVGIMNEVDTETEAGAAAVRESDESFRSISTAVSHLSTQITSIKNAAQAVATAVAQLDTAIAGVAAIAQESAATSQEVSALAEEQTATLGEITREIHEVTNMAEELRSVVSSAAGSWSVPAPLPVEQLALAAD
ncbi:MAG TPA: methyl-accepting chemotaxis protein [Gemmatimonadaceae bacterium]|jgi:methyl-accepting chemotaxis protein|nr:methyl-accepting chemotaxis protein [Gemmatimonadaceae bacterium]